MKIAKTIVIIGNICLASYASGDNIQQNNTEINQYARDNLLSNKMSKLSTTNNIVDLENKNQMFVNEETNNSKDDKSFSNKIINTFEYIGGGVIFVSFIAGLFMMMPGMESYDKFNPQHKFFNADHNYKFLPLVIISAPFFIVGLVLALPAFPFLNGIT
jgi:hypothetical protein